MATTEPASFQNPGVLLEASTSDALGVDEVFTSPWVNVSYFPSITTAVSTDQSGELAVQFSPDQINVDSTFTFTVVAGDLESSHRLTVARKWARVVYTNGSIAQTYMRLQSMAGYQTQLSAPKNLILQQDADAIAVRGNSFDQEVAEGLRSGYEIINKFGRNPDIDTATTPEDVWSNGGLFTGFDITNLSGAQTVDITSDSANDTAAGSGARTIRIEGIGETGLFQTADYALNGLAGTTTTETWYRIFRAYVLTSGSSNQAFNAGNITFTTSTSAIVIAHMGAGTSQSQLALYTIPSSRKGYIKNIYVEVSRSISSSVEGSVYVRPYGASPRLTRLFSASDSSSFNKDIYGAIRYEELTDISIRISSVSANNTAVTAAFDILLVNDRTT